MPSADFYAAIEHAVKMAHSGLVGDWKDVA